MQRSYLRFHDNCCQCWYWKELIYTWATLTSHDYSIFCSALSVRFRVKINRKNILKLCNNEMRCHADVVENSYIFFLSKHLNDDYFCFYCCWSLTRHFRWWHRMQYAQKWSESHVKFSVKMPFAAFQIQATQNCLARSRRDIVLARHSHTLKRLSGRNCIWKYSTASSSQRCSR